MVLNSDDELIYCSSNEEMGSMSEIKTKEVNQSMFGVIK